MVLQDVCGLAILVPVRVRDLGIRIVGYFMDFRFNHGANAISSISAY